MDLKKKSENLADKMNKITAEFQKNLDSAEELEVTGDDIIEYVGEKTQEIELYTEETKFPEKYASEIISLETMVEDFTFVRETLKENTENGRRVLNSVTLDLLDTDEDKRASLVMSFAELNKAVALNMKLYISSYKEISNVLLNLDRIRKEEKNAPQTVNNTVNINGADQGQNVSTVDLIKQLSNK